MQTRRDAVDLGIGHRVGEPVDEQVTPRAVAQAHPTQVPVELAARDEAGEGMLLDAGAALLGEGLLLGDRV